MGENMARLGAAIRARMEELPGRAITLFTLISTLHVSARAADIPLGESGGIYTVTAQINQSVTAQFLVDPGSALVIIPRSILRALVLRGAMTESDIGGVSTAELADSSVYQTVNVRLRQLRVGDVVLHDVVAAVSPGLSHPLLGQSFLGRFASVTFDNQHRVIILNGGTANANSGYSATLQVGPANPSALAGPTTPYSYYPYYGYSGSPYSGAQVSGAPYAGSPYSGFQYSGPPYAVGGYANQPLPGSPPTR
jgi:clan AA aspartic protease (TIGR02281 family)